MTEETGLVTFRLSANRSGQWEYIQVLQRYDGLLSKVICHLITTT
jgi:hypothetical protein